MLNLVQVLTTRQSRSHAPGLLFSMAKQPSLELKTFGQTTFRFCPVGSRVSQNATSHFAKMQKEIEIILTVPGPVQ